ncbi:Aquaporin-1 [Elasticomyces elasticus]|nr:Aquaporin-1 [Elasticomyces elasticus]
MLIGSTNYIRGPLIIVAQILGAISAAAVISAILPGPLAVRTQLAGGTTIVQGLFIEMFLTAMLVFTIFMLAAEKHEGTFIAPVGIGLALFIAELMGVYYTGGSLNPARSFGPSVVVKAFDGYHWIYWVGPSLGAILAATFYLFIKALEYETVNKEVKSNEVVGKKFDPVTKREQLITRGGSYMHVHQDVNGEKRVVSPPNDADYRHDYARGESYNGARLEGNTGGAPVLTRGANDNDLVYDHVTLGQNRLTSPGSDTTYTNERLNGNYRDPYGAAPGMEGGRPTHVL